MEISLKNEDKIIDIFIHIKLKLINPEQKDEKFPQDDEILNQMKFQTYRKNKEHKNV